MGVLVATRPLEGGSYTVDHTTAMFLIDPDGALRALFSTPHTPKLIAEDYRRIVARMTRSTDDSHRRPAVRRAPVRPAEARPVAPDLRVTRSETRWIKNTFLRIFLNGYRINMAEAVQPDPFAYRTFNDFFTRALRPGARPIAPETRHRRQPGRWHGQPMR